MMMKGFPRPVTRSKSKHQFKAAPGKSVAQSAVQESAFDGATLWICVALFAATLAAYSRVLLNGFVDYDDRAYVTENAHVLHGISGETVRWAFRTYTAGNWHPLTWLSHALDAQIFGLAAWGHHLDSVVLHGLNAVLLFLLLWKATGLRGRSLIVAALFALHPLNVQCVAWAAERKSVLSAFFFFLALGAYGWYAKRLSVLRYGIVALLFVLGLMSKPMVITLPFVLLLLDYWPLQRIEGWTSPREPWTASRRSPLSLLIEKIPLLLLSAASSVITVLAQSNAEAVVTLSQMPLGLRIENALCSYALYVFKAFWPVRLAVFYPETNPSLWQVCIALLFLAVVSVWVWRERKQRPYLLVGWLWYLGILVPVIGLVQVGLQAMADRHAYTPLIGIFVIATWTLGDVADSLNFSLRLRTAIAVVVLVILAALTWLQIGYWRDPFSLWSHAIEVTRDNTLAEENLGLVLMKARRDDEALVHLSRAIEIDHDDPKAQLGMGYLLRERDPQAAMEHDRIALSLTKDSEDLIAIYTNLGIAQMHSGDYSGASASFQKILQMDPSNAAAMMALGRIMMRQSAERMANQLKSHPTADGYVQLGGLWEQVSDDGSARQAYQAALALDPKLASARARLNALRAAQ